MFTERVSRANCCMLARRQLSETIEVHAVPAPPLAGRQESDKACCIKNREGLCIFALAMFSGAARQRQHSCRATMLNGTSAHTRHPYGGGRHGMPTSRLTLRTPGGGANKRLGSATFSHHMLTLVELETRAPSCLVLFCLLSRIEFDIERCSIRVTCIYAQPRSAPQARRVSLA